MSQLVSPHATVIKTIWHLTHENHAAPYQVAGTVGLGDVGLGDVGLGDVGIASTGAHAVAIGNVGTATAPAVETAARRSAGEPAKAPPANRADAEPAVETDAADSDAADAADTRAAGNQKDAFGCDHHHLASLHEPPGLLRDLADQWLAFLVRHGSLSIIVQTRAATSARRGSILRNGAPLAGGVAPVLHGDSLTIAIGRIRVRYWLSAEGPMQAVPATAHEPWDAMTLQCNAPGALVVRCRCGAVYSTATWRETRSCVRCGLVEDGVYRQLPPGLAAGDGSSPEYPVPGSRVAVARMPVARVPVAEAP